MNDMTGGKHCATWQISKHVSRKKGKQREWNNNNNNNNNRNTNNDNNNNNDIITNIVTMKIITIIIMIFQVKVYKKCYKFIVLYTSGASNVLIAFISHQKGTILYSSYPCIQYSSVFTCVCVCVCVVIGQ